MAKQTISAYGIECPEAKNGWGFGKYSRPFFHVFVTAENGYCWSCFGRGKESLDAIICCEGTANLEWVMEIASLDCQRNAHPCLTGSKCDDSPTYCAGVQHGFNGICHSCANRLLLPAGISVEKAPGNELATFIFGKYGVGISEFIKRVDQAAQHVNERNPGTVSQEEQDQVMEALQQREQDEAAILSDDIHQILQDKALDLAASLQAVIESTHLALYSQVKELYERHQQHPLTDTEYNSQLKQHIRQAVTVIAEKIGPDNFHAIFEMPTEAAVQSPFLRMA